MAPRRAPGRELASTAEAADTDMADDSGTRVAFVPLAKSSVASARAKGAAEAFRIHPRLQFKTAQDELCAIQQTARLGKFKNLSSYYSKKINVCSRKAAELGQEFILDQMVRQNAAFDKKVKEDERAAEQAADKARRQQVAAHALAASGETAASAEPAVPSAHPAEQPISSAHQADVADHAADQSPERADGPAHVAEAPAALRAEVPAVSSRAILTVHISDKGHVTATGSAHFLADPLRLHRILELANETRVDFDRRRHEQWVADGQAGALHPGSIVTQAPLGSFVSNSQSSLAALRELLQTAHSRIVEICGSTLPKELVACVAWVRQQGVSGLFSSHMCGYHDYVASAEVSDNAHSCSAGRCRKRAVNLTHVQEAFCILHTRIMQHVHVIMQHAFAMFLTYRLRMEVCSHFVWHTAFAHTQTCPGLCSSAV